MCLLLLCGWGEQMGLAVYPRASFAWEWKAFSEGGFAEGGLRGWLAFAACGGLT